MTYFAYHTEDEEELRKLDKEFRVVTVMGNPEDGYSDGWDLAIFDPRSKREIAKDIQKLNTEWGRKA